MSENSRSSAQGNEEEIKHVVPTAGGQLAAGLTWRLGESLNEGENFDDLTGQGI